MAGEREEGRHDVHVGREDEPGGAENVQRRKAEV